MKETAVIESNIRDIDRDSLYILPLAIIPLQTPALTRARLIKNVRLDSVIELFEDAKCGSGQIGIEDLPHQFGWRDVGMHPDLLIMRKLAQLPSFDVYSLRILLRQHNIPVNDFSALRLSDTKNKELTSYMVAFTRPLIANIYGDADVSIRGFEDIIALFRDPNISKALEKLRMMAAKLEVKLEDIPTFLEDYGDIFLSLSYYRSCLDHIEPLVTGFLEWLDELRKSWPVQRDQNINASCRMIEETMNATMLAITGRFESFDRSTKDLWDHVSADRFRKVETMIKSYHTTIGGVLCALTVKMEAWARTFSHKKAGGPAKRAEFIMTSMRQGMEKIQNIEDSAPALTQLR
ncbi:MAG: hypothetical protein IPK66_01470 [Rhodospirillales bacterium]|nr:hypothetical protein [Rhodospirillales bacterium]